MLLTSTTAQYARPISDLAVNGWRTHAGSATGLYATLDEVSANDADYDVSATDPSADILEVALGDVNDPSVGTEHVVRYRIGKTGIGQVDCVVSLRQGSGTQIASWTHANVAAGPITIVQTLTSLQADAITSYSDLRLRIVATKV